MLGSATNLLCVLGQGTPVLGHLMNSKDHYGQGPGPQGTPLTPSLPQVVPHSPSSSVRTGLVCLDKWTRPWLAGSTYQDTLPAPPGSRRLCLSVAAINATAHVMAVAVARTVGNPVQSGRPCSLVKRWALEPTTMMR